jgi:hypothetical protein
MTEQPDKDTAPAASPSSKNPDGTVTVRGQFQITLGPTLNARRPSRAQEVADHTSPTEPADDR